VSVAGKYAVKLSFKQTHLYLLVFLYDVMLQLHINPGAADFRRLTKSNFHGVEVVDWPVKPPPSHLMSSFFRRNHWIFSVQFIQYQKRGRPTWPIIGNHLA